jgi:hypothetical protein
MLLLFQNANRYHREIPQNSGEEHQMLGRLPVFSLMILFFPD